MPPKRHKQANRPRPTPGTLLGDSTSQLPPGEIPQDPAFHDERSSMIAPTIGWPQHDIPSSDNREGELPVGATTDYTAAMQAYPHQLMEWPQPSFDLDATSQTGSFGASSSQSAPTQSISDYWFGGGMWATPDVSSYEFTTNHSELMGHPGPSMTSHAAIAAREQIASDRRDILATNHVVAVRPLRGGELADATTLRRHHVIQVFSFSACFRKRLGFMYYCYRLFKRRDRSFHSVARQLDCRLPLSPQARPHLPWTLLLSRHPQHRLPIPLPHPNLFMPRWTPAPRSHF